MLLIVAINYFLPLPRKLIFGVIEPERKRGEFVSNALMAYVDGGAASGDTGILERIESRLARIEKLLMSKSA